MALILVFIAFLATTVLDMRAGQCACATGDVNVHSGVGTSHSLLGVLEDGHCTILFEGYRRNGWVPVGASSPVGQAELARAVEYVFIRDTIGEACFTQISCSALVKSIQDQHMNTFGWYDIGYNFLIGEDGYVYEGRGWNTIGGHTMGYNSKSVGIGMIGSFRTRVPSSEALNTLAALIADGVMMGKIRSNYTLRAENEINNADCHAKALCDLIRASPHY